MTFRSDELDVEFIDTLARFNNDTIKLLDAVTKETIRKISIRRIITWKWAMNISIDLSIVSAYYYKTLCNGPIKNIKANDLKASPPVINLLNFIKEIELRKTF